MNGSHLSTELRFYIPLFLEYLLVCPVERDGELIPFEKVAEELEQDTVSVFSNLGLAGGTRFSCGQPSSALSVQMKVCFSCSKNYLVMAFLIAILIILILGYSRKF